MRFRLEWEDTCLAAIDELLDKGLDPDRLMFSVRWLEFELSENADQKGEPISEGLRRIDAPAFRSYFHVEVAQRVVKIDGLAERAA